LSFLGRAVHGKHLALGYAKKVFEAVMAAGCSFVLILLDGQAVLNVEVRDDCLVGFGLEELIQA